MEIKLQLQEDDRDTRSSSVIFFIPLSTKDVQS